MLINQHEKRQCIANYATALPQRFSAFLTVKDLIRNHFPPHKVHTRNQNTGTETKALIKTYLNVLL